MEEQGKPVGCIKAQLNPPFILVRYGKNFYIMYAIASRWLKVP
ncbi:hypothetical protein [Nostoc sp. MG11]|nr:hypothetical protein [Nostoc sp. MG11]